MVADPIARRSTPTLLALSGSGALLLLGVAAVHGYLWQQGYRDIGIIGPAFLLDTVLAAGGALLLLVTPSRWLSPVAAAGALLCLGTLGALLVSTTVGLFGFVESTAAPLWWESFWVEAAGAVVLTALALIARRR